MVFLLPLPEEKSSDLREPAMQGRARIRRFPLGQCSKIEESPWESRRRNPGRARPLAPNSSGCAGLGRRSHSSADLPLPPSSSSSSSWSTGFSKLQGRRGAASRVEARGGRARLLRGPGARSRLPTPRPAGPRSRGPPRDLASPRGGGGATSGHSPSGLFCLPNSSTLREPEADPDRNPGIPSSPPPSAGAHDPRPAPRAQLSRRSGSGLHVRAPLRPAGPSRWGHGLRPQPPSPALAA